MKQDLVQAFRVLRKAPGFCTVTIVVLSVAIGTNAAVFSLMDAIFFQSAPVHAPDGLAGVYGIFRNQTGSQQISYAD